MTVENVRPPKPKPPERKLLWSALLVVVVLALAAWAYLRRETEVARPAPLPAATAPAAAAPADAPRYPVPEAAPSDGKAPSAPPLPQLADSDTDALAALSALVGAGHVGDWFYNQHLIERIVATVDALPRAKMAPLVLPVKRVAGSLVVDRAPAGESIASPNGERYTAYVQAFDALDSEAVVGAYRHWYPLFQRAYRQLGYPTGHFNDRLVEVIDHLLQAPAVSEPIAVRFTGQAWEYVDPELEARSVGQKLLLRIGAENAHTVQLKLRRLRVLLTAKPEAR